VRPHAVGGAPTADNIALRCRAHNGHEVDVFFGPGWRPERPAMRRGSGSFRNEQGTGAT
jgi:hypothetical protein